MNIFKTLLFIAPLALVGCTQEEDNDDTVLQGTWQSAEFTDIKSNKPSDIVYLFNGNNFNELISIKNNDGSFETTENTGRFTILESTTTSEGGQTVYQVDIEYNRDDNAIKFDIAYIQDRQLYFGSAKEADCSDDTYQVVDTNTTTSGGSVISTEITTCYVRPTKINFGFAFSDVN